jgi:TPR repeat protein
MPEKEPSLWADVDGDFEEYQRVALRGNGVTDWLQERSTTRVGRWEQAARAGYARGMVLLGECYEKGFGGVPQDEKQAVEWYRKAAEAGHPLAPGALKKSTSRLPRSKVNEPWTNDRFRPELETRMRK